MNVSMCVIIGRGWEDTSRLEKPAPPPIAHIPYEPLHTVVGPPGHIKLHNYALQVLACTLKDPMGILSKLSIQLFESESLMCGTNNTLKVFLDS